MHGKTWLFSFITGFIILLTILIGMVFYVDPYFHYHKPQPEFYYSLNNQRYQNDGILKHFNYNAIITGTSMTENFKTSEADHLFDANFIKVPFSGGSYKEMDDNINTGLKQHGNIKYVIRCLDYGYLMNDKDRMREDLGEYPNYLYDQNPFNDVKYILNKNILDLSVRMIWKGYRYHEKGITTFDDYSNWNDSFVFGAKSVLGDRKNFKKSKEQQTFDAQKRKIVIDNIRQNVTDTAEKYPDTIFYYFFSPYSIAYWGDLYEQGGIEQQIEAEKTAIEEILQYKNIRLFSFNCNFQLTTDLDNYKDIQHYGEWVNSDILRWMKEGRYLLTEENYQDYLRREKEFYMNYGYNQIFEKLEEEEKNLTSK